MPRPTARCPGPVIAPADTPADTTATAAVAAATAALAPTARRSRARAGNAAHSVPGPLRGPNAAHRPRGGPNHTARRTRVRPARDARGPWYSTRYSSTGPQLRTHAWERLSVGGNP